MVRSRTYIATPPGATIKEQLVDRALSQKEFAIRMDMSEKHISKLINGEVQLTPAVAFRLEMVLGIPSQFWLSLEAIYREKIIKAEEENNLDSDIRILQEIPYNEMVKYGWIPEAKNSVEKVIALRKFFEVSQLNLLDNRQIHRIACRRLASGEKQDYALMVMAQQAKIEARKVDTKAIDIKALEQAIPQIREMTLMDPDEFCPKLCNLLREIGIVVVFLPHIKGSFLHGATFYDGKKIVIGITVRGKDADKFWFSLFHELAHIIYGHIGQVEGTSDEDENDANEFAKNTLIPKNDFERFVEMNIFTNEAFLSYSRKIGIDVGILVGRMQKEGFVPFSHFNRLKTKYEYTLDC